LKQSVGAVSGFQTAVASVVVETYSAVSIAGGDYSQEEETSGEEDS